MRLLLLPIGLSLCLVCAPGTVQAGIGEIPRESAQTGLPSGGSPTVLPVIAASLTPTPSVLASPTPTIVSLGELRAAANPSDRDLARQIKDVNQAVGWSHYDRYAIDPIFTGQGNLLLAWDDAAKSVRGYAKYSEVPDQVLHLWLIAAVSRGKGIGKNLFLRAAREAAERGMLLSLNVAETNPVYAGFYQGMTQKVRLQSDSPNGKYNNGVPRRLLTFDPR